jgi:peptide/nickel transport system permease protein
MTSIALDSVIPRSRSGTSRLLANLARSKSGLAGSAIVLFVIAVAILAPVLSPYDPEVINLDARLLPPMSAAEGSRLHLLGTDLLGRDILSRVVFGSRISLLVGLEAVLLGATMGIAVGLVSGYFGGPIDFLAVWLMDVQLAFPFTLLAIFIIAVLGGGLDKLILVLAVGAWVTYARILRGTVLSVKEKDYVRAATAVGVGSKDIMLRHVLPNAFSPIIVVASFRMAYTILAEAALSFLGLGVDPSIPSWGGMLSDGRSYLQNAWWISTFPGLAIAITVLGINLLGDWLRDYLDPRLRM